MESCYSDPSTEVLGHTQEDVWWWAQGLLERTEYCTSVWHCCLVLGRLTGITGVS